MREFYSQFMSSKDVVFDIGANMGNRTRVFAELAGIVMAVEPQHSCIEYLDAAFVGKPKVVLVEKAVGAKEGTGYIQPSGVLSSLSPSWIDAVRKSGRFSFHSWGEPCPVGMTTLDRLIRVFGVPSFVKVDVEGYELEVMKGLSSPVGTLSYEFTPECLEATLECAKHLRALGMDRFNYSLGESMRMELGDWSSLEETMERLGRYKDITVFGDVYARS